MTELDDMLRGSFARIAEPGDPTGVAAAIQSRVDSGDTGTPASSSGFGGGSWLPWIGLVVVVAITGGVVGASGMLAPPVQEQSSISARPATSATPSAEPSPSATPSAAPSEAPPPPTAEPTAAPAPPKPVPVADTVAPTLANASASPSSGVCADDGYAAYYPITSSIAVYAADAVGVTGVHVSWPMAAAAGQDEMAGGPANWSYSYNPAQSTPDGVVVLTLQARDAAGNLSAPVTTTVDVIAAGSCLI